MGGLEASEIKYSNLNPEFRVDAEYHKKAYLREDSQRSKYLNLPLGRLAFITDGQHGYHEVDEDSSLVLLTAKNAKNWFADKINADRVAQWVDDKNKRSSLKVGDIIVSTRGSVGYCAIVTAEVLPANIDQDIARVASTSNEILPEFALAYLNCTIGQDWMSRNATGMVQQGLSLSKLRELPLPLLSKEFQKATQTNVRVAQHKLEQSKALYAEAETLLLDELGLKDWQPSEANVAVKSFAESFGSTGRLDAEYYQPKYDQLIDHLQKASQRNSWSMEGIGSLSSPLRYGTSTKLDYVESGAAFLRITDVSNYRFNPKSLKYISPEAAKAENQARVKTGDVLISRSGTLGLAVSIPPELNNSVFGSYFIRVRLKDNQLNSNYLALYMNALVGKLQVEQANTGAIQTNLTIPVIESIQLVLPPAELQEFLAQKVQDAFQTQDESSELLDVAKRGVEMAIEEDERAALVWMEKETDSILRA